MGKSSLLAPLGRCVGVVELVTVVKGQGGGKLRHRSGFSAVTRKSWIIGRQGEGVTTGVMTAGPRREAKLLCLLQDNFVS